MAGIIEVKGLCGSYGDLKAVQNISFTVAKGEVFGMLDWIRPVLPLGIARRCRSLSRLVQQGLRTVTGRRFLANW
jgi:hypothetical protein